MPQIRGRKKAHVASCGGAIGKYNRNVQGRGARQGTRIKDTDMSRGQSLGSSLPYPLLCTKQKLSKRTQHTKATQHSPQITGLKT